MGAISWPPAPSLLFNNTLAAAGGSTNSTTGATFASWTGKSITIQGIYLVTLVAGIFADTDEVWAGFRLRKSPDNITYSLVDPASDWVYVPLAGTTQMGTVLQVNQLFVYNKTTFGQEYLELDWKTSAGNLSFAGSQDGTNGTGGYVKCLLLPTW